MATPSDDLAVYRQAGAMVREGQTGLYDPDVWPLQLPLTYPPFAALISVPLSFGSWDTVQWLWTFLCVLMLAVTVRLSYPGTGRAWPALLISALWVATGPLSDHLGYGQVGLLLVLLGTVDATGALGRSRLRALRALPAGVLTGIAAAITLVPLGYLAGVAAVGRWRPVVWGFATAAAASLLALLFLPRDSWIFATAIAGGLVDRVAVGDPTTTGNQSINGVLLRMAPPDWVQPLWLASAATAGVLGFLAARRAARLRGQLAAYTVAALTVTLVTPIAWTHHFAWLVPALGVLATTLPGHRRPDLLSLTAITLTAAVVLSRATYLGSQLRLAGTLGAELLQNSLCLTTLLVIAALACPGRRARYRPPPRSPAARSVSHS